MTHELMVGVGSIVFAAGAAWGTTQISIRGLRRGIDSLRQDVGKLQRELDDVADDRSLVRNAINGLIETVHDPDQRRLLKAGFAFRNSPPHLSYPALRALVAEHGRPPGYVVEAIRAIAAEIDRTGNVDNVSIYGLLHVHLTSAQIERAGKIHGGTIDEFKALALIFFHEAHERGVERVLLDADMIPPEDARMPAASGGIEPNGGGLP